MAHKPHTVSMFDDESDWPRRLLHIPTMTSRPWKPGNRYGEDCEPEYIALSYTWGRWRLKFGDREDVSPLRVVGVTWDLPRIDPAHFSTAEFEQVLKTTRTRFCDLPENRLSFDRRHPRSSSQIEYAWLDVACIDQTPGSVEMASEIGRQAKIFRGAAQTFIWLTRLKSTDFMQFEELEQVHRDLLSKTADCRRRGWQELQRQIDFFVDDPWFSSLWTLQEAYLCPDALFITSQGEFLNQIEVDNSTGGRPFSLGDLTHVCEGWHRLVSGPALLPPNLSHDEAAVSRLKESLVRTGTIGLGLVIPTVLLAAAQHRKTGPDNVTDRVYGIMQVFGFRLGKARPGCDPKRQFTIQELEEELAEELLKVQPIVSQLHVFQSPPEAGKAWRPGRDSTPALQQLHFQEFMRDKWEKSLYDIGKMTCHAQLSTTRLAGVLWGQFQGRMCSFLKLHAIWKGIKSPWPPVALLALDLDDPSRISDSGSVARGMKRVQDQLSVFSQHHPTAAVLLMGRHDAKDPDKGPWLRQALGLLLVPHTLQTSAGNTIEVWRRLGICQWWLDGISIQDPSSVCTVEGESDDWGMSSGAFG